MILANTIIDKVMGMQLVHYKGQPFMHANSEDCGNVILDYSVNYAKVVMSRKNLEIMSISPIFMFAPIPLTSELSPLAQAAALARRRMAENVVVAKPRHRIQPTEKKAVEAALV